MGKMAMDRSQSTLVDASLRDELARGNRALRSLAPVLVHLLGNDGPSLVSDAIVARLRGMLNDIAHQLLGEKPVSEGPAEGYSSYHQAVIDILTADDRLIDHLYALALEGHLAQSLEERVTIDPVLSPLMQELIASQQPEIAELAMSTLAAQARFCQSQRRMELAITELPSELFASVIARFEQADLGLNQERLSNSIAQYKAAFDEGDSRIGLLARLTAAMHGGAVAGLELGHAGIALFVSAASSLANHAREQTVLACHEGQSTRLALILKAAGASHCAIEGQLTLLGAARPLPDGFDTMSQADAAKTLRELRGV